ncbi:MAG TPA: hypothetical protein VEY30_02970, partial [Myxococcaceae bacterium]|nr:hypothetical protein [Myxococcaceae bacterium]
AFPDARSPRTLRLLEKVSDLSLPGYFFHLALLHYPIAGASLAQRWHERSGVPSFLALTALLIACTYGLARLFRASFAQISFQHRVRSNGKRRAAVTP